jgi:hypothetical protein
MLWTIGVHAKVPEAVDRPRVILGAPGRNRLADTLCPRRATSRQSARFPRAFPLSTAEGIPW